MCPATASMTINHLDDDQARTLFKDNLANRQSFLDGSAVASSTRPAHFIG
jgi:hypothetical protein